MPLIPEKEGWKIYAHDYGLEGMYLEWPNFLHLTSVAANQMIKKGQIITPQDMAQVQGATQNSKDRTFLNMEGPFVGQEIDKDILLLKNIIIPHGTLLPLW